MDAPTQLPAHVPLVVATRGDAVESVYYGSIAVVSATGETVAGVGDIGFPVFTRSTLKPFQALPFVAGGGPARFGFSDAQVALMCASHSGEPRHAAGVADMLARIGCTVADLRCGSHVPLFYGATGTPVPPGLMPTPLQHNCSGKHAGFLAWCRQHGEPIERYLERDHPVQASVRRGLAELADVGEDALIVGTDGCSAPNYALPLARLAHLYAQLAAPPLARPHTATLAAIFGAMTGHPEMVSGDARVDLALMQASSGDWVAKGGAEGVQALGVRSRRLGIALKMTDGNRRALHVALAALMERLKLFPAADGTLAHWHEGEIFNYAGKRTGLLLPVFDLD